MISARIKIMSKRHEWAEPALKKMIILQVAIGIGIFEDILYNNHFPFDIFVDSANFLIIENVYAWFTYKEVLTDV